MVVRKEITMASAKRTTDHETIMKWVEERGGWPAHVTGSGQGGDPGILRIDFEGYSGEGKLEPLDWDTWFDAFEYNKLAFIHQDKTASGELSRFSKLVQRTADDEHPQAQPHQRGKRRRGHTRETEVDEREQESAHH
jgi:hypothetical protein